MRIETKIALGLIAINIILGHVLSAPEFIRGLLLGLSFFFIIIGLLPKNTYIKFKRKQSKKCSYLRKIIRLN